MTSSSFLLLPTPGDLVSSVQFCYFQMPRCWMSVLVAWCCVWQKEKCVSVWIYKMFSSILSIYILLIYFKMEYGYSNSYKLSVCFQNTDSTPMDCVHPELLQSLFAPAGHWCADWWKSPTVLGGQVQIYTLESWLSTLVLTKKSQSQSQSHLRLSNWQMSTPYWKIIGPQWVTVSLFNRENGSIFSLWPLAGKCLAILTSRHFLLWTWLQVVWCNSTHDFRGLSFAKYIHQNILPYCIWWLYIYIFP